MANVYNYYFNLPIEEFDDIGAFEIRLITFYDKLSQYLDVRINDAWQKELFGKTDVQLRYDIINDFHYLADLMMIIWEQKQIDLANGLSYDTAHYVEEYSIACLRAHFKCLGANIGPALAVFNLDINNSGCLWDQYADWCTDYYSDYC